MIRTEKVRRSLPLFINDAWEILEPSNPYLSNWHIDCMSEYLHAVNLGQIKRLIVNIPPRYMKSLQASVLWPTWSWIDHPSLRWLFASYSSGLSTKHSLDRRQVIQSPWYQERWGHIYQLSGDQNIKTEYMNTRRGHMLATSVGGTATGKGGDIIVVDDPHNPMQAESDALREAAIEFFDRTLTTRLDNKKTGAIIVIMQRLHDMDLTGHLLKQNSMIADLEKNMQEQALKEYADRMTMMEMQLRAAEHISTGQVTLAPEDLIKPKRSEIEAAEQLEEMVNQINYQKQAAATMKEVAPDQLSPHEQPPLETNVRDNSNNLWTHLCLPAIAPRKTVITFPLSGKLVEREEGDLLWPARENKANLAQVKISLGTYGFAGQYDQDPSPAGGGILKSEWWRYYTVLPSHKDIEMGVISIDCAFKDLADSDYACAQAWWKIGSNRYLIDQIRGKWSFPLLLTQLRLFIRKNDVCKYRLIEDKANGSAVIQTIRDEISGIIPVDPQGGKVARAHAVSPQVEAGNFWLPDPRLQPWVDDFTLECAKFPKGVNDDQVDCFSQAGVYMEKKHFQNWVAKIPWL